MFSGRQPEASGRAARRGGGFRSSSLLGASSTLVQVVLELQFPVEGAADQQAWITLNPKPYKP